ncbi:S-adenosyl-L-methionine-dependent methyltransferase [Cantharellus anzutake]|uniref:S-adenosyl-L-methionine-dependent methyltransferase n=1 Tax=Cantharellus anzutake TaxID=1750568 RepID=UPI0019082EB7|nr:S-adenosyl-L-methionine-dependent methyltransferase [Cantharellus anzutake]KAF8317753.1 S-adenosyl-L-methionine-dependent methyltransferase [Cantharellus anzutake]
MDVFCGGGGVSQAFQLAGVATPRWGIDSSRSACETFRCQYPEARVFNQCEVDIMSITPPSAGFSGLNRFRSSGDRRNMLIASGLSLVECFKPTYVIIENVINMARFPLQGKDAKNGKIEGGISWGVHKFVIRTLLDLGYQVRFGILQAGFFGAPQRRERMIYLASQGHAELPYFPCATHQFPQTHHISLPIYQQVPNSDTGYTCYAHHPVTVGDAISDLPGFHWKDPLPQNNAPMSHTAFDDLATITPRKGQF